MKTGEKSGWGKVPPDHIAALDAAMAAFPEAERKSMFGCPAYFLDGQMVGGAFEDQYMLRLSEADRVEALALPGAVPFEPMPGRIMREYVTLPPALAPPAPEFAAWVKRSLAYVATLPPKEKKPRRR